MAEIKVSSIYTSQGMRYYEWANVAEGDTCEPVNVAGYRNALMEIEVTGTFGGATISFNGSFLADGTGEDVAMINSLGDPLSFTAAAFALAGVNPLLVTPVITGGSSASVTVRLAVRGD